jgi:hypothetical protein
MFFFFIFQKKLSNFRRQFEFFLKKIQGFRKAALALYYFDKFAPRSGRPCLIVSKAISTSFKFVLFRIFLDNNFSKKTVLE